jgi:hypothetical protein
MVQHQGQWPVAVWCEVLDVRRSGLYAAMQRQVVGRAERHELAR